MFPLFLLWIVAGVAIVCSAVAIIWSIYAAYNKNVKIELQPKTENNTDIAKRPTDTGIIPSENSAILPDYNASKMDYKSRMEQLVHMQSLYSIDSCSDTSSSSEEEELTSISVLTRDVPEKINRKSPTTESEPP